MKIKTKDYRVDARGEFDISKWPTDIDELYTSKKHYKEALAENIKELSDLQRILYAANDYSILIILQAMDAAGKDGIIRHVMSGVNPQGCQVFSFKHPSTNELEHDFLWRTTKALPERGRIGVFNRSYYEEVLVARVHPEILEAERIPELPAQEDDVWKERFESILNFEKHIHRNGTRVIKIFLHMSKDEQRQRFLDRIDEEEKNWKFSQADIEERRYWNEYMKAFDSCIQNTATEHAPWYVVPADDKKNARLIVSQIILETLKDLKMSYPQTSDARQKELKQLRKLLEQD